MALPVRLFCSRRGNVLEKLRPTQFLSSYIALITQIGRSNNTRVWWSTLLSSKNRFHRSYVDYLITGERPPLGLVSCLRNGAALLRHLTVLCTRLLLTAVLRRTHRRAVEARFRGSDVTIIKTFGYGNTRFDAFQDPIFQDLAAHLEAKGEVVLTLYEPVNVFWKSVREADLSRRTLSYFDLVNLADVAAALTEIVGSLLRGPAVERLAFEGRDVTAATHAFLRHDHFSPNTLHSLTYYAMVRRLATRFRVRKFIYTYENNPWERQCLAAFRAHSPHTRLLAYQHNVVPLASANLFPGPGEDSFAPVPDAVLTTGPKPLEILRAHGHFGRVALISSCAIRYRYLEKISPVPAPSGRPRLLVALEGVWQAARIVDLVLAQCPQLRHWDVVLRTHQALQWKRLRTQVHGQIEAHGHVSVSSDRTLPQDLAAATAVLYWGSTVALEAIQFGKPLINIKLDPQLDYDPLFELRAFKRDWDGTSPLATLLEEVVQVGVTEHATAQLYLRSYFSPVTDAALEPFLG